jgi:hypothetical protein
MSYSKRTALSGNQSEMKTKYRINKDPSKRHNRIAVRINSKIKLP